MEQVCIVADYGDLCGEGPLWDPRRSVLYWTDITGRRFYRMSWPDRQHRIAKEGFEIAGAALTESEDLVVVNSDGIWLWVGTNEPRSIVRETDGKRCALNDCIADPQGHLFTGSCFYDPNQPDYERGCLFRLDTDRSLHVVDEGFGISNGMGFSPDLQTFYFTDSAAHTVYAYDYRHQDGSIRNRRVFAAVPREHGAPDGLTVDSIGFVWCAHWFGGGLYRYDPDGKLERHIPIPAAQTSSVMFGGPDLTDIFVTSAGSPNALALAPDGYDPAKVYSGGRLFHLNLGIQGKPEFRVKLSN